MAVRGPLLAAFIVVAALPSWSQAQTPSAPSTTPAADTPQQTLTRYCAGCHNPRTKTGGLVLQSLDERPVAAHPATWEHVARKLRARAMPPAGAPRPDDATYTRLIAYLEGELDRAALATPNPGRTDALRRLNRTEYRHAIRDLLDLDVDVTELLPADESSFGFDNVSVASLSPTLMERYLAAAQKVSRLAVGSALRAPASRVLLVPPDLTQEDHLEGLPLGTRGGTVFSHACRLAHVAAPCSPTSSRVTASTTFRCDSRETATRTWKG